MEPRKKDLFDYAVFIIGALLLAVLSLHFAVSYDNVKNNPLYRSDGQEKFNGRAFIADVGDRFENHFTEFKITESTPVFVAGAGIICLFAFAYMAASKKKRIDGKEYGTAEWATLKTIRGLFACNLVKKEIKAAKKKKGLTSKEKKERIAEIKAQYADADMLFTATERICLYNYALNNNTLIIGGSGSGKTRGFVMPNILQAHSSYIITDPKGEIIEKSGSFLENKGYKIRVLNLDEKKLSNGYNPFYYVHRDREGWEERILTLIETIIINTDGGEKKNGTDPFWDKAERLFLQA